MVARDLAAPTLRNHAQADTCCDSCKPGAEGAAGFEGVEPAPCRQQGFLQRVVGIEGGPEHAIAMQVQAPAMRFHQLLECLPAAKHSLLKSLYIGHLSHALPCKEVHDSAGPSSCPPGDGKPVVCLPLKELENRSPAMPEVLIVTPAMGMSALGVSMQSAL